MNDAPLLTVCIPTFERPEMVERAIRSVIAAAAATAGDVYEQVEIIVSDNSPDMSETACRAALADWPGQSSYLANRPDIGMVANFNQCLEQATGRFVVFVHDDDRLRGSALTSILAAASTARIKDGVLLFGVDIVDSAGRLIRRHGFAEELELDPHDALARLLKDVVFVPFPGYVVRRDAYRSAGRFNARRGYAVDIDMWARLLVRYGARCYPQTTAVYTVQATSATSRIEYDAIAVANVLAIFDDARATRVLPVAELMRYQREYFHQMLLGATYAALRRGDVRGARAVMHLFGMPSVARLGYSRRWLVVRLAFESLLRGPAALIRPVVGSVERLNLVRRMRGTN